jgi:hypothetical protein
MQAAAGRTNVPRGSMTFYDANPGEILRLNKLQMRKSMAWGRKKWRGWILVEYSCIRTMEKQVLC